MKKIILMRGLPGSGKSTKTKELVENSSLQPVVVINKDAIRTEMEIVPGDFKREKEVQHEEATRIAAAVRSGVNLIIDNTHNSPKYLKRYQDLAAAHDYNFELIDLSHVSVEECIRRDALRVGREHVGEEVILRMYNQFYNKGTPLKPTKKIQEKAPSVHADRPVRITPMVQNKSLPRILIVDLDGTLALTTTGTGMNITNVNRMK